MTFALLLSVALHVQAPLAVIDSTPPGPTITSAIGVRFQPDTVHRRHHAVQHTDLYYTSLRIHRIGSFVMLPLFVSEYVIGERLLTDSTPPSWMRSAHGAVAGGIVTVFAVNTVTGAYNLWDDRTDSEGRTMRWVHTGIMLAGEAGIVAAAAMGGDAGEGGENGGSVQVNRDNARAHRNVAVASMAVTTAGIVVMWFR